MPATTDSIELPSEQELKDLVSRSAVEDERLIDEVDDDSRSVQERDKLEIDRYKEENRELRAKHRRNQLTYKFQTEYIPKLFKMIYGWVLFIGAVVILDSLSVGHINNPDCRIGCINFQMSDASLTALLTTTTATIVGLFYSVVRWLYPAEAEHRKEK